MARGSSQRSGGTSRIRMFMFEGDLQEGELAQVTQAIQAAFRGGQSIAMRPAPSRVSGSLGLDPSSQAAEEDHQDGTADIDPQPAAARSPRKARAGKVPKSVDDLDVKSEPLLKDFVARYDVKTGFEKYLVIALWLRDTRQIDSFTVDHIYTCFKLLGWSTNSADFSKPLRNCADNGWLKGDSKGFTLTLTGAGKVEDKLRKAE